MSIPFCIVDAFVIPGKPFSGNPAAVVPLADDIDDQRMQSIALEFNLSETVFILPDNVQKVPNQYRIRWFTPTHEVRLCGHATLATGHALFHEANIHSVNIDPSKPLVFKTNFNTLVGADHDGDRNIILHFPAYQCTPLDPSTPWLAQVLQAIFGTKDYDKLVKEVRISKANKKMLIRLKDTSSKQDLIGINPNFDHLLKINVEGQFAGVIVTRKSCLGEQDKVHFMSRYFAPWVGINEDPVTGSAHTTLAPYWQQVYRAEFNQSLDTLMALQASKRSGLLQCTLVGDQVHIKGKCNTFASGVLRQ